MLQRIVDPPLRKCAVCSAKARRRISLCNQLKGAGIHLFDRRFGGKDILHDPAFTNRERKAILSETSRGRSRKGMKK
jgi:predicted nucleic acid-binding Zn ribbon protein